MFYWKTVYIYTHGVKKERLLNMQALINHRKELFVWLLLSCFFAYQYIVRILPNVMITEIRSFYEINAYDYGVFSASFLYTYALMQLCVGASIYCFGVRRLSLVSITLCVVGAIGIASTSCLGLAKLMRALSGLGGACALICAMQYSYKCFEPKWHGLLMGGTMSIGAMSFLFGSGPIIYLTDTYGWQNAIYCVAMDGVFLLLLLIWFLPYDKIDTKNKIDTKKKEKTSWGTYFKSLTKTLKNKEVWLLGIAGAGIFTPIEVIIDSWGVLFFTLKNDCSDSDSAFLVGVEYCGVAIGSVAIPALCNYFKIHKLTAIRGSLVVILSIMSILTHDDICLTYNQQIVLLVTIGFFGGAIMLCFATAPIRPGEKSENVLALINVFNMATIAVILQAIGYVLEQNWSGAVNEKGLQVYTLSEVDNAFSVLIGVIIFGLIASFILRKDKMKK